MKLGSLKLTSSKGNNENMFEFTKKVYLQNCVFFLFVFDFSMSNKRMNEVVPWSAVFWYDVPCLCYRKFKGISHKIQNLQNDNCMVLTNCFD